VYLGFRDFCIYVVKSLVFTLIILCFTGISIFNYKVAIEFCVLLNIPKDFSLTIISPGMAIDVAIILLVIEVIIIAYVIFKCKK